MQGTEVITTIGDIHSVLRTMPRAISPAKRTRGPDGANQYDAVFKQQVLDALPYHRSMQACASYYGISPRTIHRWKGE